MRYPAGTPLSGPASSSAPTTQPAALHTGHTASRGAVRSLPRRRPMTRFSSSTCGTSVSGWSRLQSGTSPERSTVEVLESCREATASDATVAWVDPEFLLEQGVEEWMDLPLWIHEEKSRGMHRVDISRALAAGLTFRPLADTVRATLENAETTDDAGLTPEREREILEAWKAR